MIPVSRLIAITPWARFIALF